MYGRLILYAPGDEKTGLHIKLMSSNFKVARNMKVYSLK